MCSMIKPIMAARSQAGSNTGIEDWSLEPGQRIGVKPGDLIELEIWVESKAGGRLSFCVSTWDQTEKAVEWSYASRESDSSGSWEQLRTRVLVPEGIVQIQPRLIGSGQVTAWVDDFAVHPGGRPVKMDPIWSPRW